MPKGKAENRTVKLQSVQVTVGTINGEDRQYVVGSRPSTPELRAFILAPGYTVNPTDINGKDVALTINVGSGTVTGMFLAL